MQKRIIVILCGIGGAFLLQDWWSNHEPTIQDRESWVWWAWIVGLLAFPFAMLVQVHRTARILDMNRKSAIVQPILMAHGMNVLLPSMLGDLYEVGALSQCSGRTKHAVFVRLIHRFSTTMSALLMLAGLAVGTHTPTYGFVLLPMAGLGPLVVDQLTPGWSVRVKLPGTEVPPAIEPIGIGATTIHMGWALLQHSISATGVFFLAIGVGQAVSPAIAAAMLSVADVVTYLPVPVGGLGVHHWGISNTTEWLGSAPDTLIAINHVWVVLGGMMCIMLANLAFDRAR